MTVGEFIKLIKKKKVNLNKVLTVSGTEDITIMEEEDALELEGENRFYRSVQFFLSDYKDK